MCFTYNITTTKLLTLLLLLLVFKPAFPKSPGSVGYAVKTVVIDAGHGGKDLGCHGKYAYEKDVALAISLKLGKFIEDNCKDVKVIYTRKTDVFIELNERANIANKANADLFICIHCNSACVKNKKTKKVKCLPDRNGFEVYVMGLHKTEGNLDVAKRENASILYEDDYEKKYEGFDPNSDEASIIFSMYQNAFMENSIHFASKIQSEFKNMGRLDREVRQAGFLVLWKTSMPAVLVETGFLTSPDEERFLRSKKNQELMARALFRAFRAYKFQLEGKQLSPEEKVDQYVPAEKDELADAKEIIRKDEEDEDPKTPLLIASKDSSLISPSDSMVIKPSSNSPQSSAESIKIVAEEIVFKIQLLSSDKKVPLNSNSFKGITNIEEFFSEGIYRYTSHNAKSLEEAQKFLAGIKEAGFKDAFVVAFFGNKKISLAEALQMIKNSKK